MLYEAGVTQQARQTWTDGFLCVDFLLQAVGGEA